MRIHTYKDKKKKNIFSTFLALPPYVILFLFSRFTMCFCLGNVQFECGRLIALALTKPFQRFHGSPVLDSIDRLSRQFAF